MPIVAGTVRRLSADRGIAVTHDHVLRAIDPGRRMATFRTPSMCAPSVVRNWPLPWQSEPFAADGWAEAIFAAAAARSSDPTP